uniref:Uncharacterized protein n=1 Tax=Rhizophora mucronata TaxID=61149 RepID=A0A2P2JGK0_RHIMU
MSESSFVIHSSKEHLLSSNNSLLFRRSSPLGGAGGKFFLGNAFFRSANNFRKSLNLLNNPRTLVLPSGDCTPI